MTYGQCDARLTVTFPVADALPLSLVQYQKYVYYRKNHGIYRRSSGGRYWAVYGTRCICGQCVCSTFLKDVQVLPENVSDIRRSTQEKSLAALAQQVDTETLELGGVDAFKVEIVDSPL